MRRKFICAVVVLVIGVGVGAFFLLHRQPPPTPPGNEIYRCHLTPGQATHVFEIGPSVKSFHVAIDAPPGASLVDCSITFHRVVPANGPASLVPDDHIGGFTAT